MSEPLSATEIQDTKNILRQFYGAQVQGWSISTKTLGVLGELIERTKACDGMMHLVPRPYGGGSVVKWGQKQVRKAILRKLNSKEGKHYVVCMKATAASMRTEFYMSGL